MPRRVVDAAFSIGWPEDWEFEARGECEVRLRPLAGGGRRLDVWYSPLPGTLAQDEMDEWVAREEAKARGQQRLTPYLGGLFSDMGPSAALQGLVQTAGGAEWKVLMLLALPSVLLTGEYHHPVGAPGAAAANIGAIKGDVDHALSVFFSARPVAR